MCAGNGAVHCGIIKRAGVELVGRSWGLVHFVDNNVGYQEMFLYF